MENKQRPVLFYTVVVYIIYFTFTLASNVVGPMLGNIMQHYSIGVQSGGVMTFAQNIGGCIAIVVVALNLDRLNKPFVMMFPIAIFAVMMLFIGLVPPFLLFVLLFLVVGMATSTSDAVGNAVVADLHHKNRNMMLNLMHGTAALGAVVGPVSYTHLDVYKRQSQACWRMGMTGCLLSSKYSSRAGAICRYVSTMVQDISFPSHSSRLTVA